MLDAHSGTTGRAKIRIDTTADLPETLFVKLQPFDDEQRAFLAMVGLGVSEAKLYAAVGDELPVRAPKVWHSTFDEADDSFIMVMEDLEAAGCRFATPDDDDVLVGGRVAHRRAGHAPRHATGARTCRGSAPTPSAPATAPRRRSAWRWARPSSSRRSTSSPTSCRRSSAQLGEMYIARNRDIGALWNEGERTLIHGDDHIGNLFVDAGRTGFYDWAVACQYPGMRDVAYFLCNSLPTEVRRAEEDALIARYRAGLADSGVTLDADLAHEQYRLFSIYSWISATTTCAMGSKWQPAEVGRRATERTTQAIIDLDVLGLLVRAPARSIRNRGGSMTVAIVTGAASGMGRACVESLRGLADVLVAADLRAPDIDGTIGVACDVADPDAVAALAARPATSVPSERSPTQPGSRRP